MASTAAQFLVDHGLGKDAVNYWRKAKQDADLPWEVSALLYRAANKHIPLFFGVTKGNINAEIKNRHAATTNDYEKGALLLASSEFGWNYRYIKEQAYASDSPVVRTVGVEALSNIARNPTFNSFLD